MGTTSLDFVVIGASMGGINALSTLLSGLPPFFPAPVLIVQHQHPQSQRHLVPILARHCALPLKWAAPGDWAQPGQVYVAPPDKHLLVRQGGRLALTHAAKVNYARPSVDVLFKTAAEQFGERVLGGVLTGKLFDGAQGALAIKAAGGKVIAQDRATSEAFDMPRSAIRNGAVDFVLPLTKIAPALVTLVMLKGALSVFGGSMPLHDYGVNERPPLTVIPVSAPPPAHRPRNL
jgi:two-component system chemotaxis response regulator CheB